MANFKLKKEQLIELYKSISDINSETILNINYNLDYAKLFVHPTLSDYIILKSRTFGVSAGMPFDTIKYIFFNSNGKIDDMKKNFTNQNAWYTFVSELREIKLVNGQVEFI